MIGPTLPPHLRKANTDESTTSTDTTDNAERQGIPGAAKPSVTGPQLPPHLLAAREAKRKRKREEEDQAEKDKEFKAENDSKTQRSVSPPSPKRLVGPSMPSLPPRVEQGNFDSDSEDDDIGPSLSSMMTPAESQEYARQQAIAQLSRPTAEDHPKNTKEESKLQRDSWMLAPPTRADWLGTLDASKLKARAFNQSRSGTLLQSGEADHTLWTETPLERAQRLEDEALGKKPAKKPAKNVGDEPGDKEQLQRDRRIKEYSAQTRGPSLMERHQGLTKAEEEDPSKRPFDYQRDIAGGQTLGFKERQDMINRAKNLDSKFSGGKYL